jgi:hypothetical protein
MGAGQTGEHLMSEEYQANKKAGSSGLSEEELQELVAASRFRFARNPAGADWAL